MFKVNHEVPLCLLEDSKKFNDYEFILPHLLDQDTDYAQYMTQAKKENRYIIMDNSLHELKDVNNGQAYDTERLMYWINEIKPNEFIIPDVWEDCTASIVNARAWTLANLPEGVTKVAVVQAKSIREAITCYQTYKDLGYQKIAFSYGANYYLDHSMHPNKNLAKALGRIEIVTRLYNSKIISHTDRVHLLGCQVPQEFSWYKDMPFIETIDTSNPIMATIDGLAYTTNGLTEKPKANMNDYFYMAAEDLDWELLDWNIKHFRKLLK